MAVKIITIILLASIIIPFGVYFIKRKKTHTTGKTVLCANLFTFFSTLAVSTVLMFTGTIGYAAEEVSSSAGISAGLGYIAAALVTGLSTIGAGIAVAAASSAALGAVSEDPKIMGKSLIFVALAEGIALYGLLVSFSILARL